MSTRPAHLVRWASPGHLVGAAAAAAYSWWAATTRPFTVGADVATAVPLGALAAVAVAQSWAKRRGVAPARPLRGLDPRQRTGVRWPVLTVLAGLSAFELYTFFSAPRALHPTLSSLYDTATRTHAWKAAFFLAWLALGWELVRR